MFILEILGLKGRCLGCHEWWSGSWPPTSGYGFNPAFGIKLARICIISNGPMSHPHLSISIPTPHLRGFRINVQHLLKQDAILQLPRLRSGWCGTTWTNFTETAVVYGYGATPWNFLVFKWKELGVMMHVPHVNEWVGVDPSRVSLQGFNWHSWILSEFVAPLTKRWKPNLHTKQ